MCAFILTREKIASTLKTFHIHMHILFSDSNFNMTFDPSNRQSFRSTTKNNKEQRESLFITTQTSFDMNPTTECMGSHDKEGPL